MNDSPIRTKSYELAIRIVELSRELAESKREYILSKQVLRSGTAIGANVREAAQAESRADFIHKMSIALKESAETEYWLELLRDTGYLDQTTFESIHNECQSVLKLLTAIIKTSKQRT